MNWALLVGSMPRKAGMERKDLLGINGKICTSQEERTLVGDLIPTHGRFVTTRPGRKPSLATARDLG